MKKLQQVIGGSSAVSVGVYLILGLSLQGSCGEYSSSDCEPTSTDKIAPVVTIMGANPLSITQGETFSDPGATATDDVDGTINVVPSGTVDITASGRYIITYTATDKAGNETKVTRTVIVALQNKNAVLLQTGQNKSYSDFDDGYSQQGLSRNYQRDDEKEVVVDKSLGLTWQDNSATKNKRTWAKSKSFCRDLSLGGYDDWRLPEISELSSLVNISKESPAIDDIFKNGNDSGYWSITNSLHSAWTGGSAWGIDFDSGKSGSVGKHYSHSARCVRGKPPQKRDTKYTRDAIESIVTDSINQLKWHDSSGDKDLLEDWQGAVNYCENLTLGGITDWRLPTRNELLEIVDQAYNPAINQVFENIASVKSSFSSRYYWSSSVDRKDNAWTVEFSDGLAGGTNQALVPAGYAVLKEYFHHIRCIQGEKIEPKLTRDDSKQTVSMQRSSLMWQDNESIKKNWKNALSYCNDLSLGGYADWRLPNKNELLSLVDYAETSPSINTIFKNIATPAYETASYHYWTSSTYLGYESRAWSIDFYRGKESIGSSKDSSYYLRCVRE